MRFAGKSATVIERIVVGLSYLTMGFVGFLWLVVSAFTKATLSNFIRYHIFQAIFISILLYLIDVLLRVIGDVLGVIPFIKVLVHNLYYLFNVPVFYVYSRLQICFFLFMGYLVITSSLGLYTYVPFVSDIISQNFGRDGR